MNNTIDKNIQRTVMNLIGSNALEYAQQIENCGLAYLEIVCMGYPAVIVQISKSEIFWNWWKMYWEKRDKEFIEICEEWNEGIDARREVYDSMHEPKTLAHAVYLNGQVLQESYAALIDKITKEEVYA